MSEACVIYTYTVHRDDPAFQRWEQVDFPDASYFSTLEEVRAEVMDLWEDKHNVFPDGVPTIQIERIETLPLTQDSLLLLLNKGFRPFIADYQILEIIAGDLGSKGV